MSTNSSDAYRRDTKQETEIHNENDDEIRTRIISMSKSDRNDLADPWYSNESKSSEFPDEAVNHSKSVGMTSFESETSEAKFLIKLAEKSLISNSNNSMNQISKDDSISQKSFQIVLLLMNLPLMI